MLCILSQRPDFDKGNNNNQNFIALPSNLFEEQNITLNMIHLCNTDDHVDYEVKVLLKDGKATMDENFVIKYMRKIYA